MPRGARELPARCLELLAAADLIVHAGDWMRESVRERLAAIGPPLIGVHGNVDEPSLRASLPESVVFERAGHEIGVLHDAGPAQGRLRRMRLRFPTAAAVIFGHSHLPLLEGGGDFQIFNPGSPTERRRAPGHTMGTLELTAGTPPRFELIEL
jgi:hypothetical protein